MQERINGRNLYYTFLAGAQKIIENQAEINRLNVFPVADADTGTNMASTIRTIVDSLTPDPSFKITVDAIGVAALSGARGNSGIIFAQFLYGFSEEVSDCDEITIDDFAESLKRSIRYLYESVSNPVEGTILTVIREWVEYIHLHRKSFDSFPNMFTESYEAAKKSLSETTQKLKILAKSNVVDAGAKGFVVFLEGMLELIKTRNIKEIIQLSGALQAVSVKEEIPVEYPEFRYCTEAMLEGDNFSKQDLMSFLEGYGNSVVVAGSKRKQRIHVHTNDPASIFSELGKSTRIISQKVEDMVRQYESAHKRKYNIALVTDSTCDLPDNVLREFQVYPVAI
ncbi:MAG: DAK2 domain-containing protein, partial [Bacteroidia bacterium]